MTAAESSLNAFLRNPEYHDILAIVKGFRNGAVYGAFLIFNNCGAQEAHWVRRQNSISTCAGHDAALSKNDVII